MVRGLDKFREHFAPFAENYVLIGGTACALVKEDAKWSNYPSSAQNILFP